MKVIVSIIFAVGVLFLACNPASVQLQEPEKYAVIELDSTTRQLYENTTPSDLKFYEIQLVDTIIKYAIADYNQKSADEFQKLLLYSPGMKDSQEHYIMDFDEYYRQYVPYINEDGEKVVSVHCFCNVDGLSGETKGLNWRKDLIQINDGGNCFFHLDVNISHRTFAHLMVNGVG